MQDRIDHIVYATPDVEAGVADLEERLGVRAVPGGRHPDFGTRNALLSLGPTTYLEIMGPDRQAPRPGAPRILGLDDLVAPRLATWVVRGDDLATVVEHASKHGVELGRVRPGTRMRMDGSILSWQLTDPRTPRADGLVPFYIHWDDLREHPAPQLPAGCTLTALRAEHPDPELVRSALAVLGLALDVVAGPVPTLVASVASPRGDVELR